jgi:hypothetical protein
MVPKLSNINMLQERGGIFIHSTDKKNSPGLGMLTVHS